MTPLFKPLTIRNLTLPSNIVQAPLAGYSCAPFRKLIHQFGGCGYATTEMISAKNLARGVEQPKRYCYKDPEEGYLCYQLSGDEPDDLAKAVEIVMAFGADLIDLNCGCPQRKIRKKGCGSKLLADPNHLYHLLRAIRQTTDLPCSAKIRVDGDSEESYNIEVADAIVSAGMDFMIVHGRHWTERYDVACRYAEIKTLVDYASIPVLANGDVSDYDSYYEALAQTGAAGVMVARGGIGRPWLFKAIEARALGQPPLAIDANLQQQLLQQHIDGLIELEGEHIALLQARKLTPYYQQALGVATK